MVENGGGEDEEEVEEVERVEGVKGLRWRKREAGMVMCGSKWLGGRGSERVPTFIRDRSLT